jgi:hypothetical protein
MHRKAFDKILHYFLSKKVKSTQQAKNGRQHHQLTKVSMKTHSQHHT